MEIIKLSTEFFDKRPKEIKISVIVLHHSGKNNRKKSFLAILKKRNLSCHYFITKSGKVFQLVEPSMRAWHAGKSKFLGKPDVNDFSIGIELLNKGDSKDLFTKKQMQAAVKLINFLSLKYPVKWIVGHKDIALPSGRKNDPASNFDWKWLLKRIKISCFEN